MNKRHEAVSDVVRKNRAEWEKQSAMIAERESYFFKGDGGQAMMPYVINIAVNNVCFMRCAMCDVGQGNKDENLKEEELYFYLAPNRQSKSLLSSL